MVEPTGEPIICPILIGRTHQRALLEQYLDQTWDDRGRVVLIAGEAGIGKSRLVAELAQRAVDHGVRHLQGQCDEGDQALPYAPWLDLLRSQLPDPTLLHDPSAPVLATLLPELSSLRPNLSAAPPLADPGQEQRRLVHALTQSLANLAGHQPLLLVVEDLHWSDEASLAALLHLARRLPALPVLLLLTYRPNAIPAALAHFLAELDRQRLATELVLPRLTPTEVAQMLEVILRPSRPLPADLVSELVALTEGNPFFVEEVVRALVAAGNLQLTPDGWRPTPQGRLVIPRSVQATVRWRLDQVSVAAQQMVRLAAVVGRRFDFGLLQSLTGQPEDVLLDCLRETIDAQLVVEETADVFAFRHALIREAIYGTGLARERRAEHGRIAAALEARLAAGKAVSLAELAEHYEAAEVWAKALDYGQQAANQAQAGYAPGAAVAQLTRALAAAAQLGRGREPALLRQRGEAQATLGAFEAAREDLEEALAAAEERGDRREAWQAIRELALLWEARDYGQAGAYCRQALAVARALGEPALVARSLNRLGNWYLNTEQPAEAVRHHQHALSIFQELDDQRGLAETLDHLGLASSVRGDLHAGTQYYEQAVVLFREIDDRQGLVSSLASLAARGPTYENNTKVSAASLAACARDAELAVQIAREIGWRAGESYALSQLGFCLGPAGEYGRALEAAQAALDVAQEIEHTEWMASAKCVLGALDLDLLVPSLAVEHLEHALTLGQEIGSSVWTRQVSAFLGSAYVAAGNLARAEALLAPVLPPNAPTETTGQRLAWCARAELALACGQPDLALQITDHLIGADASVSHMHGMPRVWKLRAEAQAELQQVADAERTLHAAREHALAYGARALLWRIHLALGRLCQAQRRRADAEREFSASRTIIVQLSGNIPDEELRGNFLRSATQLIPPSPTLSAREEAKQAYGGLTEREREVAALIARGKSNRAIAEDLVLSERTIEGHVTSILTKLGFTARTQIAAWAIEKGLRWREL